jgi:carotenoid 1,2-hydratase
LARDRQANPREHCAINVCLYGATQRWAMTERGAAHVQQTATELVVGPSRCRWQGDGLVIDVQERCSPWPRALRGRIEVQGLSRCRFITTLDDVGRHRWGPILPSARIEVAFDAPRLRWRGHAYFDSNEGDEPIDAGFSCWDWSRSLLADGSSAIIYDVRAPRAGASERLIARRFAPSGHSETFEAPPRHRLPNTLWRVPRWQRSEAPVQEVLRCEDTPFYTRSMLRAKLLGESALTMHESLDTARLCHPVVQRMLPVRMPRVP